MCRSHEVYRSRSHLWLHHTEICENELRGCCTAKYQDPPRERLGNCADRPPLINAPLTPERFEALAAREKADRIARQQPTAQEAQAVRQAEKKRRRPSHAEAKLHTQTKTPVGLSHEAQQDWTEMKKSIEANWAALVDRMMEIRAEAPKQPEAQRPASQSWRMYKRREPKVRDEAEPYKVAGKKRSAEALKQGEADGAAGSSGAGKRWKCNERGRLSVGCEVEA